MGAMLRGCCRPQLDMLRQLIATPSVSSPDARFDQSNRGVIELVAEWASALGFAVRVESLPGESGKANLIATLGSGENGLVLSGHTDTVPYDAERWTDDPFVAQRTGRQALRARHGRHERLLRGGAARDRSLRAEVRFERPITLLGTADEESTMDGARALAEAGEQFGRYAIIGEPTGLAPIRKHKGVFYVQVEIGGHAGHASNPALGVNAIEGLQRVLPALEAWRDAIGRRFRDDDFEVPTPTLNFGKVSGGDSPNRICAECTLHLDIRLLPGMERASVVEELERRRGERAARRPVDPPGGRRGRLRGRVWRPERRRLRRHRADLVRVFSRDGDVRHGGAVSRGIGASNARARSAGDIAVAHQPDEYVTIAAIERATDVYASLIQRYCIESS